MGEKLPVYHVTGMRNIGTRHRQRLRQYIAHRGGVYRAWLHGCNPDDVAPPWGTRCAFSLIPGVGFELEALLTLSPFDEIDRDTGRILGRPHVTVDLLEPEQDKIGLPYLLQRAQSEASITGLHEEWAFDVPGRCRPLLDGKLKCEGPSRFGYRRYIFRAIP